MKINLGQLEKLGFDEGSKILLAAGYVQNDSAKDDNPAGLDYILDTYFTLFDDDGAEIDIKSFVQYMQKNREAENDDGTGDIVLKEKWGEI